MDKILLIGGGGHCKAAIDVIEQSKTFQIYGIIDIKKKLGQEILGYKIIGTDDDLPEFRNITPNALITVGHIYENTKRVDLYKKLTQLNYKLPSIVSPLAYVSKHAEISEGVIVMHYAMVNAGAKIGINCILNARSLVEHDASIGNHTHISTGSIVNGGTTIGDHSFIGSATVTKEYTKIKGFYKAGRVLK